jgi:hypothetical protein
MSSAFDALSSEAEIAAELVLSGVTVLGKVGPGQLGYFGQAMFSLSVGFERLGKLIYVVKHYNDNEGRFPTDQALKDNFGHDIRRLYDYSISIAPEFLSGSLLENLPNSAIHLGVIDTLASFAKTTRFYNLNVLSNASSSQVQPALAWYTNVTKPILDKHYPAWRRRAETGRAQDMGTLLDRFTSTIVNGLDGSSITSSGDLMLATAESRFAQKWTKMYVMQLAKIMTILLGSFSHVAMNAGRHEDIPYFSDFFPLFNQPDEYFRNRKNWSIYRP